jgi:hypothetical protein
VDLYTPEIYSINVFERSISIMLKSRSIAELSYDPTCKELVEDISKIEAAKLKEPIFFFNRLKATKERRGDGKLLMETLVKILDEYKITVVNPINPYGSRSTEDLIRFFELSGFRHIGQGIVIREPKCD